MKTLLKIGLGLVVLVLVGAGGLLGWASHKDKALLGRTITTHTSAFPIPFPLTDEEVAALRRARADSGLDADALGDDELAAVARERARTRGKHLVEARYGCTECHGEDFGGGVMVDDPALGRLLGPNITAGRGGVTADFTAADWDRIVRHGVKSDGHPAAMPSGDFRSMSDQELSDIVAYIRSLPTVDDSVPPVKLGPVGTVLMAVGKLPLAADEIADHERPHPVYPPVAEATAAFGEHLASVCSGCHGTDLAGGPIAGGDPSWPPAADLTPAPDALGGWTYDQFVAALRDGVRPDGTELRQPMANVTTYARQMTDVELQALWTYLRSLPPKPPS